MIIRNAIFAAATLALSAGAALAQGMPQHLIDAAQARLTGKYMSKASAPEASLAALRGDQSTERVAQESLRQASEPKPLVRELQPGSS